MSPPRRSIGKMRIWTGIVQLVGRYLLGWLHFNSYNLHVRWVGIGKSVLFVEKIFIGCTRALPPIHPSFAEWNFHSDFL
eukprot:scaffold953_cov141-Cylindrotheca_fusiformis.AAC.20